MKDFDDDQNCFVCGKKNEAGLRLEFSAVPGSGASEALVAFPARLQGWRGTVHGGLLATVLDEAMIKAAASCGCKCVTAEIAVKYRKPAMTGAPCQVTGKVLETRGRIVLAESRIGNAEGVVFATATGKLFKV